MPDTVPGSVASTVTVGVGSTTNGTLDTLGDHDFYRINLAAGQEITVNLHGLTVSDTYLRIYDAGGNLLYENDDASGGTLDSKISFAAGAAGAYFIDVGAWDDSETGNFQFTVTTYSPPPEGNFQTVADQLISGYWGAAGAHHYNVTQGGTIRVDITGLTAGGQTLARAALQQWSDIIGVTFQEVSNGTEQILFIDDVEPGGAVASTSSEWSSGITTHSTVHISTDWLTQSGGTSLTSYSYTTYIHEIGHALGLGHGGDYNGDARYPYDASMKYDDWATTVMSYFSQQDNTYWSDQGFNFNYPTSPMIADILAMQQMYGLSTTTRAGNTTYGSTWNTAMGAITVFDAGGTDTIDVSSNIANSVINLNPGTFSGIGGEMGNVAIAFGTIIENATTGAGKDTLTGNDVANVLQSGAGIDTLNGGAGNDTLTGGTGVDKLTGGTGNDTFRDTKTGLSGDTITDFTAGDVIILTDATLAGFTFSLTGTTLTYSGGSVTLTGISGTFTASAAAGGGVQLSLGAPAPTYDAYNDFNGDGRSDVLWRNDAGTITDWLGTASGGLSPNNANFVAGLATSWVVAGTGDFNGDLKDDILWRNSDGTLTDWLGQANGGFAGNSANFVSGITADWAVAGIGDFNGDQKDDILWRNTNGTLTDWLGTATGGFTPNNGNFVSGIGNDWTVEGVGDFNGDGKDDILWRNDAGTITDWLGAANGGFTPNSGNFVAGLGNEWSVAGIGDFNGDGKDDILWRNANGTLTDWLGAANGGFTPNNGNFVAGIGAEWMAIQIGDFNGDHRDDILWQNSSGTITDWLGTATGSFTPNSGNFVTGLGLDWHVQPPELI